MCFGHAPDLRRPPGYPFVPRANANPCVASVEIGGI